VKKRGREGKVQPVEALLRRAMPPQYDVREKLERASREWESVVGPILGKQSSPLDIANGELIVMAEGPLAGSRVAMMGGNVARTLAERWGLEVVKVKVVVGRLPIKSKDGWQSAHYLAKSAPTPPTVHVREEDVKDFESRCLENAPDFPPDAAESLARLRAFFIKRFKA